MSLEPILVKERYCKCQIYHLMVLQLDCDRCADNRLIFWVRDLDDNLHGPIASVLHQLHLQSGHAVRAGDPVAAEDVQLVCKANETLFCDVHQVAGPPPDGKGDEAFLGGQLCLHMVETW